MLRYWLLALAVAVLIVYVANSQDFTDPPYEAWDATLEAKPAGSDPISQGYDWLNDTKREVRRRLEVEHDFSTVDPGSSSGTAVFTDLGRHRLGSARLFWEANDPNRIDVTDVQASPSSALDTGRIWRDSDGANAGTLKCYDGTDWSDCVTALTGDDPNTPNSQTPANPRLNLITTGGNPLEFLKNGSDPIDIHAHGSRHDLGGSDYLTYLVQSINQDADSASVVSTDTDCSDSSSNLASTITLDFSSRSGTSHVVLFGVASIASTTGGGNGSYSLFFDEDGVQAGTAQAFGIAVNGPTNGGSNFFYSASVSAASHTWDLCVNSSSATTRTVATRLLVVDLGTES